MSLARAAASLGLAAAGSPPPPPPASPNLQRAAGSPRLPTSCAPPEDARLPTLLRAVGGHTPPNLLRAGGRPPPTSCATPACPRTASSGIERPRARRVEGERVGAAVLRDGARGQVAMVAAAVEIREERRSIKGKGYLPDHGMHTLDLIYEWEVADLWGSGIYLTKLPEDVVLLEALICKSQERRLARRDLEFFWRHVKTILGLRR